LVLWDYGGAGTPLLMLHGSSMHGRCWGPVASQLSSSLRPIAIDFRGHGASAASAAGAHSAASPAGNYSTVPARGSYAWDIFASDLLEVVEQLGIPAGQAAAVGHSMGATALVLAEAMRPGTFGRIWAWEPIVSVPGSNLRDGRSAELAERARRRRSQFASRTEARDHLGNRGMFAELSPEALEAYLDGAFVVAGDGSLVLACSPQTEARVYEEAANQHGWEALAQVTCPARLLGGDRSPAVPPAELHLIAQQLPAAEVEVWAGYGHFGPFHQPQAAADDIRSWFLEAPAPTP
jgi:pimeloyl-ACP methyl ester carboxylesterase